MGVARFDIRTAAALAFLTLTSGCAIKPKASPGLTPSVSVGAPLKSEVWKHAVAALDPFRLAGLSPLVTIGGSLVIALAVLEEAVSSEEAWDAVSVDDSWQLEQWGSDAEAEQALENRKRDFLAAARFLKLLS